MGTCLSLSLYKGHLFMFSTFRLTFQQSGILAWGLAYGGFEYCRKIQRVFKADRIGNLLDGKMRFVHQIAGLTNAKFRQIFLG